MLRRLALAALAALVASSCARTPPPVVAPGPPKYPEFLFPAVPADLARSQPQVAREHELAWRILQSGDVQGAERRLAAVTRKLPAFYPAATAMGYADLARGDPRGAVEQFDDVLGRAEAYAPALVGKGQALMALGRDAEAVAAFEAAVAADATLADLRVRIDVLRLRGLEDLVADAQQAARQGRLDEARSGYLRALEAAPESAFVYRELARVERRAGMLDEALQHARRAVELDAADAEALVALGEVFEARQGWEQALDAYDRATAAGAVGLDARIDDLRERAALARLPEAYRAIPQAPRLARGDLAALIGVRLAPLLRASRGAGAVLITDSRAHWAHPWIVAVARAGVMPPYDNHTFQPRNPVRRSDLAQVASRLLQVVGSRDGKTHAWGTTRVGFSDIGPGHLAYAAASMAVASGAMSTAAGQAFQPSRVVSGAEGVETIARIERLAARAGFDLPRE
jgi:tetratricopeptide (TPR) repeat protein